MGCAEREPVRPNLIVVLTDDQGYADLGVQGAAEDVKTPHLDALAADGVRFTRAYVTAPQCVPSRAGLLTGRQQARFGMDRNRSGPLPLSERTLADRLRAAGYRTGMIGKWHLDGGLGGEYAPRGRGFDEYFEGSRGAYQANFDLAGSELPGAPQAVRNQRYRIDVPARERALDAPKHDQLFDLAADPSDPDRVKRLRELLVSVRSTPQSQD